MYLSSPCFDFYNSYCVKKLIDVQPAPKPPHSLYRPVRCRNNCGCWENSSFVIKKTLPTDLDKAKIPPNKLSQIFIKLFKSSTCFGDPGKSQNTYSRGLALFIRKHLGVFTFTKCQIHIHFLSFFCFFWLLAVSCCAMLFFRRYSSISIWISAWHEFYICKTCFL